MTCTHEKKYCTDSRHVTFRHVRTIRRKKYCLACGEKFVTYEFNLEELKPLLAAAFLTVGVDAAINEVLSSKPQTSEDTCQ